MIYGMSDQVTLSPGDGKVRPISDLRIIIGIFYDGDCINAGHDIDGHDDCNDDSNSSNGGGG